MGNMLRNSWRAIHLGPGRLRPFPWLCVIDQRISMWTSLIGPTAALLGAASGNWAFLCGYLLWVLASRCVRVIPACLHGRRVSVLYVPIQVFSEWMGAAVKVWASFHPVKQTWLNRGRRTLDSSRMASFRVLRQGLATYLCTFCVLLFAFGIGMYIRVIPILREIPLFASQPVAGSEFTEDGLPISANRTRWLAEEPAQQRAEGEGFRSIPCRVGRGGDPESSGTADQR